MKDNSLSTLGGLPGDERGNEATPEILPPLPPVRWPWVRLLAAYAVILGVMVAVTLLLAQGAFAMVRLWRTEQVVSRAIELGRDPALIAAWGDPAALASVITNWAAATGAQITAIDSYGRILAITGGASADGAAAQPAPEVVAAMAKAEPQRAAPGGNVANSVAVPVRVNGVPSGVLRWVLPDTPVTLPDGQLLALALVMLTATVLLGLLATYLYGTHEGALHRLRLTLMRLLTGEPDARAPLVETGEMGEVSRLLNRYIERSAKQLRRRQTERERLNAVLNAMTDGVIMLNRQGNVTLINPAAAQLLRTPLETALRHSFVQLVRDHRIAEVWFQCYRSGEPRSASIELNPDAHYQVAVTPFAFGADPGYLVLLQDLTHVHRLETVRRDFVSNISHELRTPLASIKALVDTLRDGALDDPPAAQRFLNRMEVEVDEMTQMVAELLELSRIESGQSPLRLSTIGVQALIAPAAERLRPQAERANLELIVAIPEDLPEILVDIDRLRAVVVNLVHNAVKFTPPGGQITVSAYRTATEIVVSVADTGTGIPADDLHRIFERFYKADRARSGGGTGLGLAIAKHTVLAHHGRVWVQSEERKGSTFYVSLPLVKQLLTSA